MTSKRLTQDQKRELIAMLEAGASTKDCELKFNIKPQTIYQYRAGNRGVLKKPLKEQFETDTLKESGCWVWQKGKSLRDNGVNVSVQRLAFREFIGPLPDDQVVSTTCKNPKCVNPEHLYLANKGSFAKSSNAKLTEDDVREMRKMHEEGKTLPELVRAFGLTYASISAIVKRKSWSHAE